MDIITFEDFQKVDIRIGTVMEAMVPEWSHWVIKMKVDLGDPLVGGSTITVFSGIMKFYKPKDLIGKQFSFVVNLEPKKIGPEKELSEGMMIMATPEILDEDGQAVPEEEIRPILFQLPEKVPNGTKVR